MESLGLPRKLLRLLICLLVHSSYVHYLFNFIFVMRFFWKKILPFSPLPHTDQLVLQSRQMARQVKDDDQTSFAPIFFSYSCRRERLLQAMAGCVAPLYVLHCTWYLQVLTGGRCASTTLVRALPRTESDWNGCWSAPYEHLVTSIKRNQQGKELLAERTHVLGAALGETCFVPEWPMPRLWWSS